ncbi:MAG: hypothetical protein LBI12_02490 [Treponema sp.]|jgi:hypothetical protein|nr:hypothetical protein [Treponema sp.]
MQKYLLDELHSNFIKGKIKRADFEGAIYNYYLCNQDKTCLRHWTSDEYEDYISWFYPRFKKAIDSYKEIGSTFGAFLGKYMALSSKEYHVRQKTQRVIEYSAWSARAPDLYTHEESAEYYHEKDENILSKLIDNKSGRKNTRRILALVLKCYYYISADFIERIAPKIGIDSNELKEMLEKICKIRQKKDDAIYRMKERIYCQYYKCFVYEKRLSFIHEDTAAFNKLKLRLEKTRLRLERMRMRLKRIRTEATNQQIAEVLNIKKGTVDASLHKLKAKLDVLAEKSMLN